MWRVCVCVCAGVVVGVVCCVCRNRPHTNASPVLSTRPKHCLQCMLSADRTTNGLLVSGPPVAAPRLQLIAQGCNRSCTANNSLKLMGPRAKRPKHIQAKLRCTHPLSQTQLRAQGTWTCSNANKHPHHSHHHH